MFFFSCIWKYVRITNEDDELTVNIFNENVTDSTTVKTTTISIYEIYDFYVTESHLHFDEKISEKSVTASNQNATVNEISDEIVVEKIKTSPKPTTLETTTISANELDEKVSVTESYLHFDEKISEKSVTVSNENASVNELSDEIVVEKINTSPKPTTLETTTISANELDEKVSVTESYLHFVEKVMTVPYQNATVNKLSDENVVEKINTSPKTINLPENENDNETQVTESGQNVTIDELSDENVVEKINTSPKPIDLPQDEIDNETQVTESGQNVTIDELSDENVVEKINASPKPQDENDNETQGADPFKLIVIVSSIILFAVVTIIIGLFIFCLRGEKKEDVMEMKKIESGEISDTFMD